HTSDDLRKQAINIIEEQLMTIAKKRNVKINKNQVWDMKSAVFSQDIIDLIEQGAKNYECTYQFIQSGAGHDAKFINDIAKTGMIFTPSVGGLGHCPEEYTSFEDIEKATNVLLYVVNILGNK